MLWKRGNVYAMDINVTENQGRRITENRRVEQECSWVSWQLLLLGSEFGVFLCELGIDRLKASNFLL